MGTEVRQQNKKEILCAAYIEKYLAGKREDKIFEEMEAELGYSKITIIQYLGSRKQLRDKADKTN